MGPKQEMFLSEVQMTTVKVTSDTHWKQKRAYKSTNSYKWYVGI